MKKKVTLKDYRQFMKDQGLYYNSSDDRPNVYSSVLTAGSEGRLSVLFSVRRQLHRGNCCPWSQL